MSSSKDYKATIFFACVDKICMLLSARANVLKNDDLFRKFIGLYLNWSQFVLNGRNLFSYLQKFWHFCSFLPASFKLDRRLMEKVMNCVEMKKK